MGSVHHPHWVLILQSIERTVNNVVRNGGIVPAALEAKRLARTYPEARMSEADIVGHFVRVGAEHGALVDVDGAQERLSPAQAAEGSGVPFAGSPARRPGELREQIWDRIRVGASDPLIVDARRFVREILVELPGSGLADEQLMLEFRRIRRVFRRGPAEGARPEG